ncbi:MAG TPA: class I SAM-dependent methyltransferase [Polyangiales bacterium]|nr:class I SAM-dependent methyltransferase [Polyangiales bacterium]
MKPQDLSEIAARTLGHYQDNAVSFEEGTRDHDVTQNYSALLDALGGRTGLRILDFGCGPGRDLAAFRRLGQVPTGLDGCEAFATSARMHTGCEVLHQNFFQLDLGDRQFDGVFANASLFHVPLEVLPSVLAELHRALVPGGIMFCSNPRAFTGYQEGWQGERYGCYLTIEGWTKVIAAAGFVLESHYLRPSGRPAAQQPWIAMVWRKPLEL